MQHQIIKEESSDKNATFPLNKDFLDNTVSSFHLSCKKYLEKAPKDNLSAYIDEILMETLAEMESPTDCTENCEHQIRPKQFTNLMTYDGNEVFDSDNRSKISVIQGPEMMFSMEEEGWMEKLHSVHNNLLSSTCPVNLLQARVGHFLGTLSLDEMLFIFATSRKSQNYYHYKSMFKGLQGQRPTWSAIRQKKATCVQV